jgi:hypothetical protein
MKIKENEKQKSSPWGELFVNLGNAKKGTELLTSRPEAI